MFARLRLTRERVAAAPGPLIRSLACRNPIPPRPILLAFLPGPVVDEALWVPVRESNSRLRPQTFATPEPEPSMYWELKEEEIL
ncbi:hypothetical protein NQ315_002887 [Exocentrus adspersus]|uniref:Uncharacterized protein n=1 Tax=Exocentrus adspersus TaxID=1586481 RepID=A0AAV8VFS5_9CUCU|nr:hypothetical protein NQ315_002887 [Exocentrus adspersus]